MASGQSFPTGYQMEQKNQLALHQEPCLWLRRNILKLKRKVWYVFWCQLFSFLSILSPFFLITDHKPLLAGNKLVPVQASSKIQHWANTLASFEYTLEFHSTSQHSNADVLSRLPLPETPTDVPVPSELVLLVQHLENAMISAGQIKHWTLHDPVLAQVSNYIKVGWPKHIQDEEVKQFWQRQAGLSILDDHGEVKFIFLNKVASLF